MGGSHPPVTSTMASTGITATVTAADTIMAVGTVALGATMASVSAATAARAGTDGSTGVPTTRNRTRTTDDPAASWALAPCTGTGAKP